MGSTPEDFRTTTRTIRQMLKCSQCKAVSSRLVTRQREQHHAQADLFGNRSWVTRRESITLNGAPAAPSAQCKCGRSISWLTVEGKHSAKHQCGAKCRNSTGTNCECSCGGLNHGAGFSS